MMFEPGDKLVMGEPAPRWLRHPLRRISWCWRHKRFRHEFFTVTSANLETEITLDDGSTLTQADRNDLVTYRERELLRRLRCPYREQYANPVDRNPCRARITHVGPLQDWYPEIIYGCEEHIVALASQAAFSPGLKLAHLERWRLPSLEPVCETCGGTGYIDHDLGEEPVQLMLKPCPACAPSPKVEEIECPACSRAGGAGRGVFHLPPVCPEPSPTALRAKADEMWAAGDKKGADKLHAQARELEARGREE